MDIFVDEKGVRQPLKVHGLALLALSFQTLGITFADIGTSPLYTLNGVWPASSPPPSKEDVIGGISAIVWAMTLLPLLKYVFFVLRFGTDEGEGGTFALFHGIYPPKVIDYSDERALVTDFTRKASSSTGSVKTFLTRSKWVLLAWSLFGTSLTFADGMLTPAVSVTSAVGGIAVSVPSVSRHIESISVGFLVALFLVQRFGTAKISHFFSPVTFVWLLLLGGSGIYNITLYPGILRAFDPSRAVMFFIRTKQYDLLAGVLLAMTGCEAMFANLGQFNRISIQLSFTCLVYPACILAYLGQGAQLVVNGDVVIRNVFFASIPGGSGKPFYWIIYVFAIIATLIASQAIVTATFSLCQQVINMRSLPPVRMDYTSEIIQGQIYIPSINWVLCAGTIIFVLVFKDNSQLTNAYGFSVATVMFVTTTLIAIQIICVKNLPWILAVAWLLFFGFLDGLFWGASLRKVPMGAWVPLVVGSVTSIFMVFWTWAKGLEDQFDGANRRNLRQFIFKVVKPKTPRHQFRSSYRWFGNVPFTETPQPISSALDGIAEKDTSIGMNEIADVNDLDTSDDFGVINNDDGLRIPSFLERIPENEEEAEEEEEEEDIQLLLDIGDRKVVLPRMSTMAVFHKLSSGKGVPHTFYGFLKQWPALPRVVVFLSVRVMPVAHVEREEMFLITKARSMPGFYGATYMKGFRDKFKVDIPLLVELIAAIEARTNESLDQADKIIEEIRAASRDVTHVVPHYHVLARRIIIFGAPVVNWIRRLLIEDVYRSISYMFPETVTWLQAADEIVHVGITAEI